MIPRPPLRDVSFLSPLAATLSPPIPLVQVPVSFSSARVYSCTGHLTGVGMVPGLSFSAPFSPPFLAPPYPLWDSMGFPPRCPTSDYLASSNTCLFFYVVMSDSFLLFVWGDGLAALASSCWIRSAPHHPSFPNYWA